MDPLTLALFDNPVWNALTTGNSDLASGNDQVKFFPAEVGPFVGLKEINEPCFNALFELTPAHRVIAIVTREKIQIPDRWKIILNTPLYQMIAPATAPSAAPARPDPARAPYKILPLHPQHIPRMLSLTKLTNPGPFFSRTIEFGNYHGIFDGDQLIAMAGQRMHIGDCIEVSAVCTHPDHLGHGYATALMLHVANLIRVQNAIPFLHVRTDNANAIKLYQALGFSIHQEVTINILQKMIK
jgi:GNAT superfamily N-acetyltransferase